MGMGYPLRLKRVTARIPAQTVRGTRAEEPQAAHGVEVRAREKFLVNSFVKFLVKFFVKFISETPN